MLSIFFTRVCYLIQHDIIRQKKIVGGCASEVWNGQQLKLYFIRKFDDKLIEHWFQLLEIATSVV